jgi:hypothetical protein
VFHAILERDVDETQTVFGLHLDHGNGTQRNGQWTQWGRILHLR